MSTFELSRGAARAATILVNDDDGTPLDLTGRTVTMTIDGPAGVHLVKTATLDTPLTLGTGTFSFAAADFVSTLKPTLRRDRSRLAPPYDFAVWLLTGSTPEDLLVGTFDVVDIPARV